MTRKESSMNYERLNDWDILEAHGTQAERCVDDAITMAICTGSKGATSSIGGVGGESSATVTRKWQVGDLAFDRRGTECVVTAIDYARNDDGTQHSVEISYPQFDGERIDYLVENLSRRSH